MISVYTMFYKFNTIQCFTILDNAIQDYTEP